MSKDTRLLAFLAVQLLLVGCVAVPSKEYKPLCLGNREEIAKHLPADVKLDTIVSGIGGVYEITVEQELAMVGAYVGSDSKLRDKSGDEIYFLRKPAAIGGPYIQHDPEEERQWQEKYEELQKHYRVIVLKGLASRLIPC